jgi:hypothetical protein
MKTNKFSTTFALLVGIYFLCSLSANAQTITGLVKDAETNEPLPGVSITVKGSSKGTLTNVKGEFSLNIPNEKTLLVFSFVGYIAKEIEAGNTTKLIVSLQQDSQALDEVVVVGYGTVKKSDYTSGPSSPPAAAWRRISCTANARG